MPRSTRIYTVFSAFKGLNKILELRLLLHFKYNPLSNSLPLEFKKYGVDVKGIEVGS